MRIPVAAPAAIAAASLLSACGGPPRRANEQISSTTDNGMAAVASVDQPPSANDEGAAVAVPQAAAATAASVAPGDDMAIDDSARGAVNVLRHYYADLDRGDFHAAYQRWGNGGLDSRQSFADFKRGFAETASTAITPGQPGDSEGAAGSLYIDVPVTIYARLKNGATQTFSGHYTLRRVNNVPGSTQAQRRWHIYSADLKKG